MDLVIITGMSGAGKSLASKALEDIGYYCVDNMPPALMPPFAQLCRQSTEPMERVALVTDVRSGSLFEELQAVLPDLTATGLTCRVLFLDCSDEVLCRRYKETRRLHPLMGEDRSIEQALEQERQMLAPLRDMADYRMDTTHLSAAQLKGRIAEVFMDKPTAAMTVQLLSFGFKYGFPAEADMLLDVRCLPNPYYIPELKHKTGLEPAVQAYVLNNPDAEEFLRRLESLLNHMLPLYHKEGRSQLVIAIGCTGGKHRSVTMVNRLAQQLANERVLVYHRDIGRE